MTTKRTQTTNRTEVDIRIPVPTVLHARLRHRAFDEGLPMKDAVIAAIEAWVVPARRQGSEPDLDQVRAEARALGMRELFTVAIEGRGAQALLWEAEDAAGLSRTQAKAPSQAPTVGEWDWDPSNEPWE
jgi:hypothetical protein